MVTLKATLSPVIVEQNIHSEISGLFIEENVVSLFHWALFVLNFDYDWKNLTNTGKTTMKSPDFRINILLTSWEDPSLFVSFIVSLQRKDR